VRISLTLFRRAALLGFASLLLGATGAAAAPVWQPPLRPVIVTRAFEPPPTPYAAGHRGVDLAGRPGEPVLAAAGGDVSYAGRLAGRGVVVVVHGALRTTYEPVQASVRRGAHVAGGEQIGTLAAGHAGCPVAACLHWGLLRGDAYLDPMAVLSSPPIRLLPPAGSETTAGNATTPGNATTAGQQVPGGQVSPARVAITTLTAKRSGTPGPSPTTWSLVALAGAGVLVAHRRR
jgi:MYXO-CTERM domain-containing protein